MPFAQNIIRAVLGAENGDLTDRIILTPFLSLKSFRPYCSTLKDFYQPKWFHGFSGKYQGRPLTVVNCGLGAQRAADCLTFLRLAGVKRVLLAGAVAGLKPLRGGDFLLAVSACQLKNSRPGQPVGSLTKSSLVWSNPSKSWLKKLARLELARGPVFSTPTLALIGQEERRNLFRSLKRHGLLGLDLETAAFYETAGRNQMKALALHFVSDCPDRLPFWEEPPVTETQRVMGAKDWLPRLALEIMKRCP